jgi:two-component system response regulator HydG
VDVVSEWIAACEGRGIRLGRLPDDPRHRAACLRVLRARASAGGLPVVTLGWGCCGRTPVDRHALAGRSVLVIAAEAPGPSRDEAMEWLRLARSPVRVVAVALWRPRRGATHGRPPRVRLTLPDRFAGAVRRARQIETVAWQFRRRGREGRARAAFGRATDAWIAVGAAEEGVRALAARARLLADRGDLARATTEVFCAQRAARAIGRHRWSAAGGVRRVRLRWATADVWPAGRTHEPWVWPAAGDRDRVSTPGGPAVMEDLVQVLQACHDAEDAPSMSRMCSVVRERLGAAAVGVVVADRPGALAGAGHTPFASEEIATRVLGTGEIIDPSPRASGIEAAVPVRLGGAPIGALCCRWAMGSVPDTPRARALLLAAATACAPGLRVLLDNRRGSDATNPAYGIIGASEAVSVLRDAIRRAAAVPFPVLIEGESGSGKELVARAIHEASARRRRRFCAVNCAAISDDLFEAELFGHAKGAFTGALGERPGLFEEADGGTLLLDEVGELTPRGQAKLLRVLQEGEVRRVGENAPRRIDVRVVAASNRPLAAEARARRFRDDLRFRLDVVRIAVPPLRERRPDIPLLADHYWRLALERTGGRARLDETTVDLLTRYDWPGNVRELQNLMATLAVRAPLRGRVRPSDLPFHVTAASPSATTLQLARRQFDAGFIRATLARCGGQRTEAARQLGMTRQGLAKLIARLDIEAPDGQSPGMRE